MTDLVEFVEVMVFALLDVEFAGLVVVGLRVGLEGWAPLVGSDVSGLTIDNCLPPLIIAEFVI